MNLESKLSDDLKQAMRAKDALRVETIRNIRGAIRNKELDTSKTLDEAAMLAVIRSLVKQRDDSIEQYKSGGRDDLVEKESRERDILLAYLPKAPDSAQVQATVSAVVAELGANSMKDMGKVMKACQEKLGPATDTKKLSELVKAALGT